MHRTSGQVGIVAVSHNTSFHLFYSDLVSVTNGENQQRFEYSASLGPSPKKINKRCAQLQADQGGHPQVTSRIWPALHSR